LHATVNRPTARPEHFNVWLVTHDGRHLSLGETPSATIDGSPSRSTSPPSTSV
jgi:hypothetical protein